MASDVEQSAAFDRRWRPTAGHRSRFTARRAPPAGRTARPIPVSRPAAPTSPRGEVVLDVRDLKTYFFTYDGVVRALDGVNLTARRGETTGVVGETGCGKSVTAFSIVRLISEPGRVMSGEVRYRGADLLWGLRREARFRRKKGGRVRVLLNFRRVRQATERMSAIRGRKISMIFQEPSQALNPVFSISDQVGESLLLHRGPEIISDLLTADRAWRSQRAALVAELDYTPDANEAHPAAGGSPIVAAIEALVHAAPTNEEEMRRESDRLAQAVSLPSVATEAYYVLRTIPAGDPRRRTRLARALRRVSLTGFQRSYLRHQRRLMDLKEEIDEISMREMAEGRSYRTLRRIVQARALSRRLQGIQFRLPGARRRAGKPLLQETFWETVRLLEGVRIANPVQVARGFPHELSGGMLQRVMIAMALSSEPDVLIADEPTTALDVTIQAQILELMRDLRERVGTAILLITHDLGVVAEVCDRVNVMYAGLVVENAPAKELFRRPLHPYTQGLLSSIPRFDQPDRELQTIAGSVPNLITPPPGCRFHPRCPYAMPICKEVRPEPTVEGPEHTVSCHLYTAPPEGASTSEGALPS